MRLFIDTSAFIALEDRSERVHPAAKAFFERLTSADRLHTSNYVVDETITRLRYMVGHGAAVKFADAVLGGRLFDIAYVDADLEKAAVRVLKKFKDKKLSFTDCTSIALVERQRLDGVFAFDDDFTALGMTMFPLRES